MQEETLFTVFFENPFWVGIFEKRDVNGYSAAKVVFGPEPADPEILAFIAQKYPRQINYSKANIDYRAVTHKVNPKRQQREASKLINQTGISSKAKETLKLEYENNAQKRKKKHKEKKIAILEEKYEQKAEKKKQKKKGH